MHESNRFQIKNEDEIYNLLKKIQKSKQLISLSFKSLPNLSLTSLLDVHKNKQILVFDEPNPTLTTKQINKKNEAKFSLRLNKLPIVFETKLISNKENRTTNELHSYFPTEIYYPQNRNFHRFRTEYLNDITVTLFISSKIRIPSKLINISINGLCLRLPYSLANKFQTNQIIEDIFIQLPNQYEFSTSAIIKSTRIENNYTNFDLGLEINQHKPRIEKAIQQFIFRTENNNINTNISL